MTFLRILFKILAGLVVVILIFLAFALAPVDDTPYQEMPYYAQTKQRLAQLTTSPAARHGLLAGWSKVNITPSHTTPTGGYGERLGKHWQTLSDSIFARAIMLDNGGTKVAIVALDLVITPPTVTEALKKRLPEVGLLWETVYMGAIHSHNSMGGWAPRLVGQLIAGGYDEEIVKQITDGVLAAIRKAQMKMEPVQIAFGETDASDMISNRLSSSGPTGTLDGKIRLLEFRKRSGESALLCSFAGHPKLFDGHTCSYLSRDYPASLVDRLE